MPINQERMISLIEAASDFQQALTRLYDYQVRQISKVDAGQLTPQQLYENMKEFLHFNPPNSWLDHVVETNTALSIEKAYFKRNRRRNESAKLYNQRRRLRQRGYQPTSSAAASATSAESEGFLPLDHDLIDEEFRKVDTELTIAKRKEANQHQPISTKPPADYAFGIMTSPDVPDPDDEITSALAQGRLTSTPEENEDKNGEKG